MLMFDKTTNRHRGETSDPDSLPRVRPLQRPPQACFLQPDLGETSAARLISQSTNLDQDKASLSTSSPFLGQIDYDSLPALLRGLVGEGGGASGQEGGRMGGG